MTSFPSFQKVHDDMCLEEIQLGAAVCRCYPHCVLHRAQATIGANFFRWACAPPPPQQQQQRPPQQSGKKNNRGNRGRNGGSGGGGNNGSNKDQGANAPWPSFFNPWTDFIQMWPGPGGLGQQAPR
jgi:hypothetical protein